jgi:hypothetical protein
MLTWANTVAGWWTSASVAEIQRQQWAVLNAITKVKKPKSRRRRPIRRDRR